ncbi:MAG: beta/gamma crystallin family protein [Caulobacterales bacterium]|nr:beta/gamma crystallin family protein [Caulobacterales bacterium]
MKAWLKVIIVAGAVGAAMPSGAAGQTGGCPNITTTTSIGPNGETITRREGCGGYEITSSGGQVPPPATPPSRSSNANSSTTTTTNDDGTRTRTETRTETTTESTPGGTTTETRTRSTSVTTPDFDSQPLPLPPIRASGQGWSIGVGGADTPDDDDFDDFPQPPPDFARIVLFDRANFRGRSIGITQDTPNLERRRFADVASAARVQGGVWELCSEPNFGGTCVETGAALDLESASLNDTVASVRRVRP